MGETIVIGIAEWKRFAIHFWKWAKPSKCNSTNSDWSVLWLSLACRRLHWSAQSLCSGAFSPCVIEPVLDFFVALLLFLLYSWGCASSVYASVQIKEFSCMEYVLIWRLPPEGIIVDSVQSLKVRRQPRIFDIHLSAVVSVVDAMTQKVIPACHPVIPCSTVPISLRLHDWEIWHQGSHHWYCPSLQSSVCRHYILGRISSSPWSNWTCNHSLYLEASSRLQS